MYIVVYFSVESPDAVKELWCGVVVPCLYFVFYVSTEGWVVVSDGAGGNVLLARPGDYFVEVFYREPYVVVICYVVVM